MEKYFAIIRISDSNSEQYKFCGTGFFINDSGLFATAGHVLRNAKVANTQPYICFPGSSSLLSIYPIVDFNILTRRLYNEHERTNKLPRGRDEFQCGYEYKDVAVGKVELSETPFYEFELSRPRRFEKLKLYGYILNKELCPEKEFSLIRSKVNSRIISEDNKTLDIKSRLAMARIPYLSHNMKFENIDLYNNCLDVYGDVLHGNSGAPLVNKNGKVSGIFVAGNNIDKIGAMHLSKYVSKKVQQLIKLMEQEDKRILP